MPVHPDDLLWTRPKSPMRLPAKTVGLVLFTAACLATFILLVGYDYKCIDYEGVECAGRRTEWAVSALLSIGGWVAAALMLHFAFRGPRRMFVALAIAALALYVASALFADAF
jgi:hypothetical protein